MLLTTKLFVPSNDRPLVARPRLLAKLDAGLNSRVTLVAAPAGFGKTTLITAWCAHCGVQHTELPRATRPPAFSTPQFCWLALDEHDNDFVHFLAYVVATLQTVDVKLGAGLQIMLQAPQLPPPEALLTTLINDVEAGAIPIVLVLEDYHVITAHPIHAALTFLVDNLPSSLRLVITTRSDPPLPLARWRVRNQLTEVRASDLRFTTDEAATFLSRVMGLTLSGAQIATLEERTEGWIAALQLAALSMQGRHDPTGFIAAFSGSNRFIVDYLAEEVWQRLPVATQTFLMQTSLLDRFCASLCQAVTGQFHAQALLATLDQANLFLINLDDERCWYRYHHLFRDLLHHRLLAQAGAPAVKALHQRAANWYAENGLFDEAIHHCLAAGEVERAADQIETVGYNLIGQGYLSRLCSWLDKLPADLVRSRPLLVLWRAWTLNLTGQPVALERWLREAELSLPNLPAALARDVQAQITTLHAYKTRRQGHLSAAIAQLQQALADCAPENYLTRTAVNLNLGFTYWVSGQLALADQAFQATQTDAEIVQATHVLLVAKATQAMVAVARGKLRDALSLCEAAIQQGLAHNGGRPFPSAGYAYAVLGEILYERNEAARAAQALAQALALGDLMADGTVIRRAIFRLALLKQMDGDDAAAQVLWQRAYAAEDTVEEPQVALQQVRAWLVQAGLTADPRALANAAQWAATYSQRQTGTYSYMSAFAQTLVARTELLQGQPVQALARLAPLAEAVTAAGHTQYLMEILVLQALAHAGLGDVTAARVPLGRALQMAAPEGYVRLFADHGEPMHRLILDLRFSIADWGLVGYVDKLLAAFGEPLVTPTGEGTLLPPAMQAHTSTAHESKVQTLVEPLSARELEVLRLVADGLSNHQIAEALIVTVGTAKKHLNNIFGKLGVGSRTQAIARARELQLL